MMRLLVLLLALFPLALPVPATAKGATDVVVSGPGIDDVHLRYTRRAGDVDVMTLAEASGVYLIYGAAQVADDPQLGEDELGPRYRLEWSMGETPMVTSYAYPFARTGGWAEVPDEVGGWVRGGPRLTRQLVRLGAVDPEEAQAVSYDAAIAAVIASLAFAGVVLA